MLSPDKKLSSEPNDERCYWSAPIAQMHLLGALDRQKHKYSLQILFSVNKLTATTICFAIGATTATSIGTFANNEVVICSKPNPEAMMEQVIQHFKEKSAVN